MGIWKFLFGKSKKNNSEIEFPEIPGNFRQLTKKAIELIGRDSKNMGNEELFDYLVSKGIPDFEAGELIVFLPTAFTRKMLPDLKWLPNYYDVHTDKRNIKRKYNKNVRYQIMEKETEEYWNSFPNNEYILNIAGRSAEFHAINKLLNNGGKLENVRLTASYVIR